jgi:two-component system NtrC family sensor kinase
MSTTQRPAGPADDPPPAESGGHEIAPDRILQINRLAMQARFVSGLAHEINNSLQVMGGLVELLVDRADLPAEVRVRLQKIGDQADRAGAVIRQVLAFARSEPGHRRPVDLVAAVDRAVALRRYQLGRLGVELAWDPAAAPRVMVEGDERQLQQAILNLIVNAEEALEAAPARRLSIRLEETNGRVRCTVKDSGCGIPRELRPSIFEPFRTTRSTSRNLGLGLPAAAAIVAAHHGSIDVEDGAPGTAVVVELPIVAK